MKLLWSPKSPFVRKVMIVAHELGLADRLELVRAVAIPRGKPNPVIIGENPLGKIPILLVDGIPPIFDSSVICDYLSTLVPQGKMIVPRTGKRRLVQLRWQSLGDGLTENLLLWRIACLAETGADPGLVTSYHAKVRATMRLLDGEAAKLGAKPFGIGQIAILCALGQLDFRFRQCNWRDAHPALATWEALEGQRLSVASTGIVNDQAADEGPHIDLAF